MRVAQVEPGVTHDLRRTVLRPDAAPGTLMPGDTLAGAVHLAAFDQDDAVVGTCLLAPMPYPLHPEAVGAWQLRAMATAPPRRNQGIGGEVLQAAIAVATERGGLLLWCNARNPAVAFYTRHGFAVEGPEFVQPETGLPHRSMWRDLTPGG